MQRVISDPRGIKKALLQEKAVPGARDCLRAVVETPSVPRLKRLGIYSEAYFARLLESLQEDFGTIEKCIGESAFRKLIMEYVEVYPSRSHTLADLGRYFPEFLRSHPIVRRKPYVLELAELEWACVRAFYAPDDPRLEISRLQSMQQWELDRLRLKLGASVTLLKARWNVDELWGDGKEKPGIACRDGEIRLLVYREGFEPCVERLETPWFEVLEWIASGTPLGGVCEDLLKLGGEVDSIETRFQEKFLMWASSGVIGIDSAARNVPPGYRPDPEQSATGGRESGKE